MLYRISWRWWWEWGRGYSFGRSYKDISGKYSDDENEELQTLVTSPSLSAVGNESTINNYDQDKRNIDKSSVNQIQNPLAPSQQSGQSLSHNRPDTDNSQTKGVKTKLCKNIAWVVGETETVYKLDTARQKMNTQQAPFTQTTIKTLHQCKHKSWLSTHHLRNSKGNRKSNTTLIMTVLKQV